jgi:hypothetical protein
MKKNHISVLAISIILFTACNSGGNKNEQVGHEINKDTLQHAITGDNKKSKKLQ